MEDRIQYHPHLVTEHHLLWAHELWVQVPALPPASCVASTKALTLSEPILPSAKWHNGIYLVGL